MSHWLSVSWKRMGLSALLDKADARDVARAEHRVDGYEAPPRLRHLVTAPGCTGPSRLCGLTSNSYASHVLATLPSSPQHALAAFVEMVVISSAWFETSLLTTSPRVKFSSLMLKPTRSLIWSQWRCCRPVAQVDDDRQHGRELVDARLELGHDRVVLGRLVHDLVVRRHVGLGPSRRSRSRASRPNRL